MYIIMYVAYSGAFKCVLISSTNLHNALDTLGIVGTIIYWAKLDYTDVKEIYGNTGNYVITELTKWV